MPNPLTSCAPRTPTTYIYDQDRKIATLDSTTAKISDSGTTIYQYSELQRLHLVTKSPKSFLAKLSRSKGFEAHTRFEPASLQALKQAVTDNKNFKFRDIKQVYRLTHQDIGRAHPLKQTQVHLSQSEALEFYRSELVKNLSSTEHMDDPITTGEQGQEEIFWVIRDPSYTYENQEANQIDDERNHPTREGRLKRIETLLEKADIDASSTDEHILRTNNILNSASGLLKKEQTNVENKFKRLNAIRSKPLDPKNPTSEIKKYKAQRSEVKKYQIRVRSLVDRFNAKKVNHIIIQLYRQLKSRQEATLKFMTDAFPLEQQEPLSALAARFYQVSEDIRNELSRFLENNRSDLSSGLSERIMNQFDQILEESRNKVADYGARNIRIDQAQIDLPTPVTAESPEVESEPPMLARTTPRGRVISRLSDFDIQASTDTETNAMPDDSELGPHLLGFLNYDDSDW